MPDEDRKPYMTIIGIIIESAALYAASGIVLTVTNALGHPSEQVAVSIYMLIPSIAAYMVVLRVGLGLQFGFAEGQDNRDATGRTRGRRQRVPGTGTGIQFDHGTFDLRSRGAKSTAYGSGSGTESGTGTGSVSVSGEGQPMVHVVGMDIERGEKVVAAVAGAGGDRAIVTFEGTPVVG
ncbi:hypothetical protein BDZ94DRAFT_867643 [Collybia nuda]|uniref:Uncharacterized protein n=1 Tax=Collybia nuda TaxID=64659 RepID=A0A9P6CHH1_9AGAR|nr:hypothetical protein BDZ94DRAFT_867643 [Collybia nuda]